MVAAVTLAAKQRGGPKIACQLLFYPVTDADFDDGSSNQFTDGLWPMKAAIRDICEFEVRLLC